AGVAATGHGPAALPVLLDLLLAEAGELLAQDMAFWRGFVAYQYHHASLLLASLHRLRLACDRQLAGQNRSRFEPPTAVPQDSPLAALAAIGSWRRPRYTTAWRMARLARPVKRLVARSTVAGRVLSRTAPAACPSASRRPAAAAAAGVWRLPG